MSTVTCAVPGLRAHLHEGDQHRRHEAASVRIVAAIATMRRYNRYRVPYFQDLLAQARKTTRIPRG